MDKDIYIKQNIPTKAILFIIFLTVIFGSSSAVSKLVLANIDPITATGLRFIIASLSIAFWAFLKRKKFRVKIKRVTPLIIISVGFTFQIFLSYLGINLTYASRCVIITNSVPFFIMILSHYFIPGEKVSLTSIIGCCVAFIGIIFTFSENINSDSSFFLGDISTLASVMVWASITIYTKRIIVNYAPFHIVFYPMIFLSIISIFIGIINEKTMIQTTPVVMGAIIYQGVIVTAFGFVAWNTLLKKYGATSLHSFIFLTPISGIFSSNIILDEKITRNTILSLIFVVIGLFLINKTK